MKHLSKILFLVLAVALTVSAFVVFSSADEVNYTAKIGDEEYSTLDAAMKAAKNGDTVTLYKDTSIGQIDVGSGTEEEPLVITVDLNGHTVYNRGNYDLIYVRANTTIKFVGEGTLYAKGDTLFYSGEGDDWANGKLIIGDGEHTITLSNEQMSEKMESILRLPGTDVELNNVNLVPKVDAGRYPIIAKNLTMDKVTVVNDTHDNRSFFQVSGNLTVKNSTIVGQVLKTGQRLLECGGDMLVENVTVFDKNGYGNPTMKASGSLTVRNVTFGGNLVENAYPYVEAGDNLTLDGVKIHDTVHTGEMILKSGWDITIQNSEIEADNLQYDSLVKPSGKLTIENSKLVAHKMTDAFMIRMMNTGEVSIVDSTIINDATGRAYMFQLEDLKGKTLNFHAKNSQFLQVTHADDAGESGKGKMFNIPADSNHLADGSVIQFEDCVIRFKWRAIVAEGSYEYPATNLALILDRCDVAVAVNEAGEAPDSTGITRKIPVIATDCLFNTDGSSNSGDFFLQYGGSITLKGNNFFKKAIKINGIASIAVVGGPEGFPHMIPTDDGYMSKFAQGAKKGIAGTQAVITANGSNAYYRYYTALSKLDGIETLSEYRTEYAKTDMYAQDVQNKDPNWDENLNFTVSGGPDTYPFSTYRYLTLDFDLMTDTAYQDYVEFNLIARSQNGNVAGPHGQSLFFLKKETEVPEHLGEWSLKIYTDGEYSRYYLENTPYDWHHITVLVDIEENDGAFLKSAHIALYVDGVRIGTKLAPMFDATKKDDYINQLRITYGTNTQGNKNDAICLDNVVVNAYAREGGNAVIDALMADASVKLTDVAYASYGESYQLPEVAPIAEVNGKYFTTLKEGYEYAVENNATALTLLRATKEEVDIKAALTVYTNGIDWVPTEDSWGFERGEDENGAYYQFSEELDQGVEVWWFSNPFQMPSETDEGYCYIANYKGGRRIAHPAADGNIEKLQAFAVRNADGSLSFYRFVGWTEDPETNELVKEFPIVDSTLTKEFYVYYAVFEELKTDAICAFLEEAKVTLDFADAENDYATYQKEVDLYTYTLSSSDYWITRSTIWDYQDTAKPMHIVLLKDLLISPYNPSNPIQPDVGFIFNGHYASGLEFIFDLNGHKLVHITDTTDYRNATGNQLKALVFEIRQNTTVHILSSQEGGMVQHHTIDRTLANVACTGGMIKAQANNITLTVDNLLLRDGIFLESNTSNVNVTFTNCVFDQYVGDSWAAFMIRNTSNPGAKVTVKDSLFISTANKGSSKSLFDLGEGKQNYNEVIVENVDIYYPTAGYQSPLSVNARYIVERLGEGGKVTLTNVRGDYLLGANTPKGGVIYVNEGCTFDENPYESWINSDKAKCVVVKDGYVIARSWETATLSKWFPEGFTSYDCYNTTMSAENYMGGDARFYNKDIRVRNAIAAKTANNLYLVKWHQYDDLNAPVLAELYWTNRNGFYVNDYPAYTDENGITYRWTHDLDKEFANEIREKDGVKIAHRASKIEDAGVMSITGFKQNVKLTSDFTTNLFIPKYDFVASVKVGGVELLDKENVRVIDGKEYYVVSYTLGAHEAANEVSFLISYSHNGVTSIEMNNKTVVRCEQTVKISVASYANALVSFQDGQYKDLANAMLQYAKQAYLYVNGGELPAALNVADAESHEITGAVNTMKAETGIQGIAIELGEKPAWVLALDGKTEGTITITYTDYAGHKMTLTKEVLEGDTALKLNEIALYDMGATMTIALNGEEVGTYNFAAYATSSAVGEKEVKLVAALDNYIAAAKAYKAAE